MDKSNPLRYLHLRLDRYTLCGLAAILLWSTTIAVVRSLTEKIGPLTSAASVYLLGGLLSMIPFLFSQNRIKKIKALSRHYLFGCGALFVFYMLSLYLAVGLAKGRYQVLEVGLVNYLWPALTLVLSVFLLGKSARSFMVLGILLGLLGIFLVLTVGTSVSWTSFIENITVNPWAYSLALSAALSWGFYSNLSRRWGGGESAGGVPIFMLTTGLVLLFIRLLYPEQSSWNFRSIAELLFMSLATLVAYGFWDLAMRKGDVVLVAACSYFTPFFSTLVSCLYLGVAAGLRLWLGCGCIILGSFISWASVSERSKGTGMQ